MNRTLYILNIVAFVITVTVSYLSNSGVINGETMSSVSGRYANLFTPAGYAFSIWGLIYISLAAFFIYQGRNYRHSDIDAMGGWFIMSCIANSAWVIAWLYDLTGLSVLIMILLLFSLVQIILKLQIARPGTPLPAKLMVHLPFSIYTGLISVALIANVTAWLTKIEWSAWGISEVSRTIILIIVAGIINLVVTWTRSMGMFSIAGSWALVAIAVANRYTSSAVAGVAITTAGVLMLNVVINAVASHKKRAIPTYR